MKNYILLFLTLFLFTNCNDDDGSSDEILNIPKLTERYSYYDNNISVYEKFVYKEDNDFVYRVMSDNSYKEFEYSENSVKEKFYSNNELRNIAISTYQNGILKREFFDKNLNLKSYTESKIVNNKVVDYKGYDSNSNLEFHLTSTYENNGLKEVTYNHLTNETTTTIYHNQTIKNRTSAFAYLIHDNQPLTKEIIYTDDVYRREYILNSKNYPIETKIYDKNGVLKLRVIEEYQ